MEQVISRKKAIKSHNILVFRTNLDFQTELRLFTDLKTPCGAAREKIKFIATYCFIFSTPILVSIIITFVDISNQPLNRNLAWN